MRNTNYKYFLTYPRLSSRDLFNEIDLRFLLSICDLFNEIDLRFLLGICGLIALHVVVRTDKWSRCRCDQHPSPPFEYGWLFWQKLNFLNYLLPKPIIHFQPSNYFFLIKTILLKLSLMTIALQKFIFLTN